MSKQADFLSVIKNTAFRSLWINQILVQLAYNTLNFALIIWVFKLTHTNIAVSVLMLAVYLPSVVFGLFAGVIVDRLDRRKIILAIDLCLALAFLSFVLIRRTYPLLLLNTFLINSLAQFFMPSESSSIPMLVSRSQLFLANSLFSLTLYASVMIGFSIGGPILGNFGINAIFIMGAVMLILAFLLSQSLPAIKVKQTDQLYFKNIQTMWAVTIQETSQTLQIIKSRLNVAAAIALMAAVQGGIGMLAVMMPSFLERALLIHAADASYFVMIPTGIGMVAGTLIIGRFFHGLPRRKLVIPAIISAGVLLVLIGIAPGLGRVFRSLDFTHLIIRPRYFLHAPSLSFFMGLLALLLGFVTVSVIVPCQTVIQENTPEEKRGRIFAVLSVFMTAASAIPVVLAGILSDFYGSAAIFTALGVVVLMTGLLAKNPSLVFGENHLPIKVRQFLGLGHWKKKEAGGLSKGKEVSLNKEVGS